MLSFFFLSLIFCIDYAIDYQSKIDFSRRDVKDPVAFAAEPIPDWEDYLFVNIPCFDFVWSGPKSKGLLMQLGLIIPVDRFLLKSLQVKHFETPDAADIWLYQNQLRTTEALHLKENNSTMIEYEIQTNNTQAKHEKASN